MKTEQEIERDIFALVMSDPIASAIGGGVYRAKLRPYGSQAEDITVKFLSGADGQEQTGVVIINLYVPDMRLPDGRSVPSLSRIAELQRILIGFPNRTRHSEYHISMESSMRTLEATEITQHYINCRLRFRRLSDNY